MDTDASVADSRVVEADIKHDCDVLILEYLVWDALDCVIGCAQSRSTRKKQSGDFDAKDARDVTVHEVVDKLRMVDSYLSLCRTSDPTFSLSPQTSFLIQLLQFSALLTLRYERSAICAVPGSITNRRQANHTRAERWREAAGSHAWPLRLLDIYSAVAPQIVGETAGQEAYNENTSNGNRNENSYRISFRDHNVNDGGNSNGHAEIEDIAECRDQGTFHAKTKLAQGSRADHEAAADTGSGFVTLLDLLPLFMDLTATIMSSNLHDHPTPPPSSPTSAPDDQDKTSTTSDMVWASEPQWLDLAAKFMLQAVMEQYLDLQQFGSASPILDAFAWGKFPTVQNEPFTTDLAKDTAAMVATRGTTIPDSDEGDITALGNTPASSPDNTPSSHPSLFVTQAEDSPESAGATWRHLRLQALSLLEPSQPFPSNHSLDDDGRTSPKSHAHIENHLRLLSSHHTYSDFETLMLDFLAHLYHSRQPPLLTQLETVYPAWMASGPPGMLSQSQGTQTLSQSQTQPQSQPQGQSTGDEADGAQSVGRNGWLAAAHLTVRACSMELTEDEVDTLMHMLSMQWFCA